MEDSIRIGVGLNFDTIGINFYTNLVSQLLLVNHFPIFFYVIYFYFI